MALSAALAAFVCACAAHEQTTPVGTPAVVPTLVGRPVGDAVAALEGAGLHPVVELAGRPIAVTECASGRVSTQDSPAGEALVRGSAVTIGVASCDLMVSPTP